MTLICETPLGVSLFFIKYFQLNVRIFGENFRFLILIPKKNQVIKVNFEIFLEVSLHKIKLVIVRIDGFI